LILFIKNPGPSLTKTPTFPILSVRSLITRAVASAVLSPFLHRLIFDIMKHHLISSRSYDLRNAGSHEAGTGNDNFFDFHNPFSLVAVHAGLQLFRGNDGGRGDPRWNIAGQIAPRRKYQGFRGAGLDALGFSIA
jgi:hypothetical protein